RALRAPPRMSARRSAHAAALSAERRDTTRQGATGRQSPARDRWSLPTAGAGDSTANPLSLLSLRRRQLGGGFLGRHLLGTSVHRAREEQRKKTMRRSSQGAPVSRSVTATVS